MKFSQFSILTFILFLSCSKGNELSLLEDISETTKPNILLIIADDMGLDATPGYNIGDIKPTMPTLQGMMNSGLKFNNLWSNPTCTPTRGTIITGKYGFRTNVTEVGDVLSTSETSLQKHLDNTNSGYNHAVIGNGIYQIQ